MMKTITAKPISLFFENMRVSCRKLRWDSFPEVFTQVGGIFRERTDPVVARLRTVGPVTDFHG